MVKTAKHVAEDGLIINTVNGADDEQPQAVAQHPGR
jgi:hypothetical protein